MPFRVDNELVKALASTANLTKKQAIRLWQYVFQLRQRGLITARAIPVNGLHKGHRRIFTVDGKMEVDADLSEKRVVYVNATLELPMYGCSGCNAPAGKYGEPVPSTFTVMQLAPALLPESLRNVTVALVRCSECIQADEMDTKATLAQAAREANSDVSA